MTWVSSPSELQKHYSWNQTQNRSVLCCTATFICLTVAGVCVCACVWGRGVNIGEQADTAALIMTGLLCPNASLDVGRQGRTLH